VVVELHFYITSFCWAVPYFKYSLPTDFEMAQGQPQAKEDTKENRDIHKRAAYGRIEKTGENFVIRRKG
jgi:hypothetical protein